MWAEQRHPSTGGTGFRADQQGTAAAVIGGNDALARDDFCLSSGHIASHFGIPPAPPCGNLQFRMQPSGVPHPSAARIARFAVGCGQPTEMWNPVAGRAKRSTDQRPCGRECDGRTAAEVGRHKDTTDALRLAPASCTSRTSLKVSGPYSFALAAATAHQASPKLCARRRPRCQGSKACQTNATERCTNEPVGEERSAGIGWWVQWMNCQEQGAGVANVAENMDNVPVVSLHEYKLSF